MHRKYVFSPKFSIAGHPHIRINSSTECRKPHTPHSRSLRSSFRPENPTRDTPGRYSIRKVILRSILTQIHPLSAPDIPAREREEGKGRGTYALNATYRPREYRAHETEILRRTEGSSAHVFEAASQLLFQG